MKHVKQRRDGAVSVILTRWFLIIAISYAIILSAEGPIPLWPHQALIATILVSNLVLMWMLRRGQEWTSVSGWATGLDIAAVSLAISVAGNLSTEFYLVYFSLLILSAVIDGIALLTGLAFVTCAAYGTLLWIENGVGLLYSPALLIRLPVLLGVALYFGTSVQQTRRDARRQANNLALERGKALAALSEMGRLAVSGDYPGAVSYQLASWVQQIVEFDRCSLLVFAQHGRCGYLAASGDDPGVDVLTLNLSDYPEVGSVARTGEFTEVHESDPGGLWQQIQAHLPPDSPFSSFVIVPIKRAAEVIGAFYLRDSETGRTLSDPQREFVFQAAHMAAAFIHEHDLLSQLQDRSNVDALTGLPTYQTFLQRADRLAATDFEQAPVSLALINIDNIRAVNRRWGHEAGNELIGNVGRQLRASLGNAEVCRYGADEFVALLNGSAADAQNVLQEQFLDRLAEAKGELPAPPSASIGIASFPTEGSSPAESLLEAAQRALRVAKDSGGHRIEVYSAT